MRNLVIKRVKFPPGRKKRIFKISVRQRGCEVLRWMGWFCISRIARMSFYWWYPLFAFQHLTIYNEIVAKRHRAERVGHSCRLLQGECCFTWPKDFDGRPELYMKHGCIIFLFPLLSYAVRDRKPSPLQNMTDQKQLENVKYFNYLGRVIAK